MENASVETRNKGWNVDADPDNEPTYPIRRRLELGQNRATWTRPEQQPIDIEILRSIERPDVTSVFGTSTPPAGLSGMIRRLAFRYSESSYLHWLPLVLADRVNVIEGLLDDLAHAHIPNVVAEAGGKAEWQYHRKSVVGRLLFGTAVAAITISSIRAWRRSP